MNATNQEPHQDSLVSFGQASGAHAFPSLARPDWIAGSEESAVTATAEFFHMLEEFARRLDECDVSWRYKPRTFAVEWDENGNFVDCFTPDFYLPELALICRTGSTRRPRLGGEGSDGAIATATETRHQGRNTSRRIDPHLLEPPLF